MKCEKCGSHFPMTIKINGVRKNLCNRKRCLLCSPFGVRDNRVTRTIIKDEMGVPKPSVGDYITARRRLQKKKAIAFLGGCCQFCNYSKCEDALEFHHLDPLKKKFALSSAKIAMSAWSVVEEELRKCILLCANCHRELHYSQHVKDIIFNNSAL